MALEVIGGAFFSGLFQSLFGKVDSAEVRDFLRGKRRTDGLLEELRRILKTIDVFVDDAEGKSSSNPKLKEWLDELQDAVFRAEDVLNELKTDALLKTDRSGTGSGSSRVRKVHHLISNSFHHLHNSVDERIVDVVKTLESIAKRKDAFNLESYSVSHRSSSSSSSTPPSTSLVPVFGMCGRKEELETITKLLLLSNDVTGSSSSNCNKIGVIPIVGLGGIGKTTLAQLVYNDDRVKANFDTRAWVCVSEDYDVTRITQTLCSSVNISCDNNTDLNKLQEKLEGSLRGKKFLIVLDDIWNENYSDWDRLRTPFKAGAYGSKIIVTTRSEKVASKMGSLPSHCLKEMSEHHCWELFKAHAFQNPGVGTEHSELERIGRQIVKKCKGLPLAAKSLGGLLRSDLNVKHWEYVLNSEIWESPSKESDILPALWLSYQHLPSHLKRCFAYCAVFPKDSEFSKSELALLWMYEDLLQPESGKMMEEVGENYFDELVSRSFFQTSQSTGDRSFTMHDLIHDVAKFVYGKFCIRLEIKDSLDNVKKARHFFYKKTSGHDSVKIDALYEA